MKYGTQELYNIDPKECALMTHYEALTLCKEKAVEHRNILVHEQQHIHEWNSEKEEFIKYISKTINWCELKLDEMSSVRITRFSFFIAHIVLAFKALRKKR